MNKINLDKRLIDESLRIRKDYLHNINEIKKNENLFKSIKNELNTTYENLENSDIDREFIENKILDLTKDVNYIQNIIEKVLNEIKILKTDADKLYENIKEKNPNISENELIELLSPYMSKIDDKYKNLF